MKVFSTRLNESYFLIYDVKEMREKFQGPVNENERKKKARGGKSEINDENMG